MSLASIVLSGFSLMSLTDMAGVPAQFDAEARHVDVIEVVHTKAQVDSEQTSKHGMRVDVIDQIGSHGPAYPYARPVNRCS